MITGVLFRQWKKMLMVGGEGKGKYHRGMRQGDNS
jgi:hypothetical protein